MSGDQEQSRGFNDLDIKLLWGLSAARCAFPGCREVCILEGTALERPSARRGRIAHIVAHSDTGPRSSPSLSPQKRREYENLILLCANHHDDVDAHDATYTVEILRQWKREHEQWVKTSLAQEMPKVGFAELEVVCRGILSVQTAPNTDFRVLAPEEKMAKNGLTAHVRFLLEMGYAKVPEVGDFVTHIAKLDYTFPERLVAGFREEYDHLVQDGIRGDGLFFALQKFASLGSDEIVQMTTGLAVLSYLFQTCEVFEH